ncbi:MAG: hypothetical protein AAF790_02460 [Planctomycetota bacterium]
MAMPDANPYRSPQTAAAEDPADGATPERDARRDRRENRPPRWLVLAPLGAVPFAVAVAGISGLFLLVAIGRSTRRLPLPSSIRWSEVAEACGAFLAVGAIAALVFGVPVVLWLRRRGRLRPAVALLWGVLAAVAVVIAVLGVGWSFQLDPANPTRLDRVSEAIGVTLLYGAPLAAGAAAYSGLLAVVLGRWSSGLAKANPPPTTHAAEPPPPAEAPPA